MIRQLLRSGATLVGSALMVLTLGAAPIRPMDPRLTGIEHARLIDTLALHGEVFHVQGLALDAARIWVTSVDRRNRRGYLHVFDRATGAFLHRRDLTDGARYHVGGVSLRGGAIWVPVAEMRPDSSATLLEIDTATLATRRTIRIPDHVGFVAASAQRLVAGNWDSRLLYVLDPQDGRPLRIVPRPSPTRYQDAKFVGGQLVAAGHRSLWSGTLDFIDWPSMTVRRTLHAGAVGRIRPFGRGGPLTGEGMAIEGRDLFVLPEDGPTRLIQFRLDS